MILVQAQMVLDLLSLNSFGTKQARASLLFLMNSTTAKLSCREDQQIPYCSAPQKGWCYYKPDHYRPISLQNCPLKTVSKALTSRLQPLIHLLIHPHQTGIIKGRSISKNFNYAAELTQTCYKRRIPIVALKLDFIKAFDSIEWLALYSILEANNFPPRWRQWVQDI